MLKLLTTLNCQYVEYVWGLFYFDMELMLHSTANKGHGATSSVHGEGRRPL